MCICLALIPETLHPTQFLLSLVCRVASVVHRPFSLGWLGQWAFLLWHGSVHNVLHTSGSGGTSSSGAGQTAKPALLLAVCVVPGLSLFLSPAFVSAAQAEKFFGQRLILTMFIQCCVNGEWRPEVGRYLRVPLWILMMPKACSDRWDLFIKCSWVCMWNKLDCCPYCMFCLNNLVHRWCNLGRNAGSKIPASNRRGTKDFTILALQGCWTISCAATSKPVSLMLCATFSLKWNESQNVKVLLSYLLKC